jgi:energy-coupling factor transporter ATP-binding protein EcfA2
MPITFDEIAKIDNGAQFFTADLHIHSFGGSSDVKDASLTPEAIIDAAIQNRISIICITDHNNDKNSQAAIDYAQRYAGRILVLAGVEISTAHGHLLAYFAPEKAQSVRSLLGQLNVTGEWGGRESHTAMSMADVISRTDALGGIAVAAHIDRPNTGFEMLAEGYPNWKKDILASSGLYGLECDNVQHLVWYSEHDEKSEKGGERRKLVEGRAQSSATAGRIELAHIQNSDSHTLANFIGQIQKRELTRFKLNELSFEALRTAFVDPSARVRTIATLPVSVPRILGVHITGGFLDGQTYRFSDNLNCFIGGRGAGKSTALRTVAYALGIDKELGEHDNCPDNIVLYAEDGSGVRYRYERNRGSEPVVLAKQQRDIKDVPSDAFRIEYYGQGELSKVAEDPLRRPDLLQEFLDRHIVLSDLRTAEQQVISSLLENSSQLTPVEANSAQLSQKTEDLKKLDIKLDVAKTGKVKELAEFQIAVAAEKSLRNALADVKKAYDVGLSLSKLVRNFEAMAANAGPMTTDPASISAFSAARTVVADANAHLNQQETKINEALKGFAQVLQAAIDKIADVHRGFDQTTATRVAELQKKGLSVSVQELDNLIRQRGNLATEIDRIQSQQPQLQQLRQVRSDLLGGLYKIRNEILTRRKTQISEINANLAQTIKDYTVVLYYDQRGDLSTFKNFFADIMRGTYFQDDSMIDLCAATTPDNLAKLIASRDLNNIATLGGIGEAKAAQIIERFQRLTTLHRLEVIAKEPCPVIKVITRRNPPKEIPINQLSDGQKHTILLTIAMLAESNLPLIIDQPEDDLDNAFIFSSIVSTLRDIKERRQVILVTHNANIAVLGDSELILPMRRKGDSGDAFDWGGIDKADTRKAVQEILEGGPLAFRKRKELYGY